MGIVNVNMLQGNIDNTEYLTSYTDIYLKEALANLGQRTGIKGDGISQGMFKANELINNYTDNSYLDKYFVHAAYDIENNIITASLFNTETMSDEGNIHTYDMDGKYTTDIELVCDEYHSPYSVSRCSGSVIQHNDLKYQFTVGELSNIGDTDLCSLMKDEVTDDGLLIEGLRIKNDENDNTYLYNIYYTENNDDNICYYKLDVYQLDLGETTFNDIFNGNDGGLVDCDSVNDALIWLLNGDEPVEQYDLYYDTEASQFFCSIDPEQTIDSYINEFAYDITAWFKVYKETYNKYMYFKEYNNVNLKTAILTNLVKSIYENSDLNNDTTILVDNKYNVYIPALYNIYYFFNDNNDLQIYSSYSDIYVRYQEVDISKNVNFDYEYPVIIAEGSITKITSFKFSVIYDEYDNVIEVVIEKVLTLPYIANGYWFIDDKNTGIYAIGENAGQPNIIITCTDYVLNSAFDYKVLHAAEKDLIGDAYQQETVSYKIPHQIVDANTTSTTDITVCLPSIENLINDKERKRLLENALIISMTDVHQSNVLTEKLSSGYVTTFWGIKLNEDSTEYIYSPVMLNTGEGGYALDMDAIANLENYVKYSLYNEYEPDRYEHQWLVFTNVTTALKQQIAKSLDLYPNIRNKVKFSNENDPLETFGNYEATTTEYHNPTNMVIEYSTNVEIGSYGINNIGDNSITERYFNISYITEPSYKIERVTYEGQSYYARVFDGFTYTYAIDNVINYYDYPNEVIPNSSLEDIDDSGYLSYKNVYPTLELKEILLRNANIINRANVIGIDPIAYGDSTMGGLYYAYFGVSVDGDRKKLKIGTSNTDSNFGAATLVNKEDIHKFNKFNDLDIDIDYTNFNSYAIFNRDAFMNKTFWKVTNYTDNDTSYNIYSAVVRAIGTVGDIFNLDVVDVSNSRYMNELGLEENAHKAYDTTLNVDKFLASIALDYEGATIYCDNSICNDYKMHLTTSNISIDENRIYNDVYVSNPIEITYTDAIKTQHEYKDYNSYMVYSYLAYTGYDGPNFEEHWTCDGCEACASAVQCTMYANCKHTSVELIPHLNNLEKEGRDVDEIMNNNTYIYQYSYEYATKSGMYQGTKEDYDPTQYTYAYLPIIVSEREEQGKGDTVYFNTFDRTINIREIYTTTTTPEYQNKL